MSIVQTTASDATLAAAPISRLRRRLGTLLVSHTTVDMYSMFIPPIIGLLEVRCELGRWQTASLLGFGSISSGLSQPAAAWLSDRFDSRLFAPLGLLMAAVCLSCIGLADSFATLLPLYILGMIGVGIYHPVGASSMGHLSGILGPQRRTIGISTFFVAGMVGGMTGSIIAPAVTAGAGGFDTLRWLLLPGLLLSIALVAAIRRTPHGERHHAATIRADGANGARWRMIVVLYISNAMRFTVNMALFYLYVRWAQALMSEPGAQDGGASVAVAAAPIAGRLNACTILGMAIGGLSAGALIRAGHEKRPMMFVPLVMAPCIALFPLAGRWGGYGLAVCAGVGFASMIPVAIGLSQRLLPHRTSLASGLMMGGAWSLALLGPVMAEWMLTRSGFGLSGAFISVAALLAASGLMCMLLDRDVLLHAAQRRVAVE